MNLASPQDIELVCTGLDRAWRFLSGTERTFVFSPELEPVPALTEYCYFMPLQVRAEKRRICIGVFLQRSDALAVAAHMFGTEIAALQDADLHDACAEACNVLSDCMALHIGGSEDVHIELPFLAGPAEYAQIASECTPTALYIGGSSHPPLCIVVYQSSRQTH
nr:hypothetical protein [uncultured Rhodoferax sp.]